jgi:colanic acid/amylovoran biosynthesis protein
MDNRRIVIGLFWHAFDSGNHGVNALTVSNIALAREAAEAAGLEPRFVLFAPGWGTASETTADGHEVIRINRRSLLTSRTIWSRLATLDCVLDISAGDSFADIYGAKRFFWMWGTKFMTLLRGVPLVLSPQTIGPFTRQPFKWLAGDVMNRAKIVMARDPLSYDAVGAIAPRAKRMLSADVAFRLPFMRRAKPDDGKLHVGVNVSGLLWVQSGDGGNKYGLSYDYAEMTTAILDKLTSRGDVVVHLITHVVDKEIPSDNDGWIVDKLAKDYPDTIRVPDFAGPSEAKSYISGLDVLIAARMHACIAAFSSGVPVLPVAYSRKFVGLFQNLLGYSHTLPQTGYDTAAAAAFLLERIDSGEDLAAALVSSNARVSPLLDVYIEALRKLFGHIANKGSSDWPAEQSDGASQIDAGARHAISAEAETAR